MRDKIREYVKKALQELEYPQKEIVIEVPQDRKNGDYATNIAMQLTKDIHKNPRMIAEEIIANIPLGEIDHIDIAGPGFINFFLKKDYLFENINTVLAQKESYGSSDIGAGKKINLEFVSANPTGILHLGHARGASYGDALARILTFAGYDVTREYYINDAGNQIAALTSSIEARYRGLCGEEENMPENGYYGKEIRAIAEDLYREYLGKAIDIEVFKQKGLDYLLTNIETDLTNYRVSFDVWTSEKSIYERGKVKDTLQKLIDLGHTYEKEGAIWLKTTDYGDEKDRVLVKSDGSNTYLLPDIAYHIDKYERGFDTLIDVLGADHHGYIPRLKASIAMMGKNPDQLEVKILQMVRLVRNGEEVKMSKRTGNAVTMNELVEEVGLNATRYFFAMRSLDTQMDFDLELASKKTNENPVYYVEYAYARICSILEEYKNSIDKCIKYDTMKSDYVMELLAKLYEFENTVKLSAIKKAPNIITNYVYELATLFHAFYAHEKVLTDDPVYTKERLNMIQAVAIVLKKALELIGVEAREKM